MTEARQQSGACNPYVRLFTLRHVKQGVFLACVIGAAGCGVKTVYLHDGNKKLDDVAVVVWSSPDPPADAPSIALAKIDDKKLEPHAAPVNRAEVMPGTHNFMVKASYPSASAVGAHKPPPKAMNSEGPAKFSVKNVSLSPGACYVVASDLLGDAWLEPVVRDARPTDPGFKFCHKR
jgi:hypothetical protein